MDRRRSLRRRPRSGNSSIWLTPHGFLKGAAAAGNATLSGTEGASVLSFTALGKYKVDGTIDAQNHVTKVATKIPNPVMGDTDLVATYSDYKDFSGVQFPTKIVVEQGGFPLWDLTITNVMPNAPLDLAVPEPVASAAPPSAAQTMSTKLANGVWHVTGGSHHSVVVEFSRLHGRRGSAARRGPLTGRDRRSEEARRPTSRCDTS